MKKIVAIWFLLMIVFTISACSSSQKGANIEQSKEAREASALAENDPAIHVNMINTSGDTVGTATLTEVSNGVNVAIEASNLPKGTHGFHIHEKGICEQPDFESAGGHFNPTNAKHGFDNPDGPHAGDLPNLEVGEDGTVNESFLAEMVTLKEGEKNSLLHEGGTSLVIHADADDNVSQPAGNAGARIACGVIAE